MPVIISKTFRFEAAHWLPGVPPEHKCRRLHGHSFVVDVKVYGEPDPITGMVMDFGDIKKAVKPYINKLDHWCINEVGEKDQDPLLMNPTSENLAKWFFQELRETMPGLYSIIVHETCTSQCEYRPDFPFPPTPTL